MTAKYKYILDSSIWVEIERGNPEITKKASLLINKNQVCTVDLIVAEMLRGVRTQKDYDGLKLRLCSFEVLSTSWLAVSELAFRVAKNGFQPPLADLYIAQCCIDNKRILITQDKHFKHIHDVQPFRLKLW